MLHTDADTVIDEFTGGGPRADEWREMRRALAGRQAGLSREREETEDPVRRAALEKELAALARQLKTLETEEVVARFVEDSIKASLARAPDWAEDDGEEL